MFKRYNLNKTSCTSISCDSSKTLPIKNYANFSKTQLTFFSYVSKSSMITISWNTQFKTEEIKPTKFLLLFLVKFLDGLMLLQLPIPAADHFVSRPEFCALHYFTNFFRFIPCEVNGELTPQKPSGKFLFVTLNLPAFGPAKCGLLSQTRQNAIWTF